MSVKMLNSRLVCSVINGWQPGTKAIHVSEAFNTTVFLPGDPISKEEIELLLAQGVSITLKRGGRSK